MEDKIRILYIDDESHNLSSFVAHFRRESKYQIYIGSSGEEGLSILNNNDIHIIIADQRMAHMTGIEFIEQAIKRFPEPMRIVVTAHREVTAIVNAFNEGKIFCYHDKPWNFDALQKSIDEAYNEYCNNKIAKK